MWKFTWPGRRDTEPEPLETLDDEAVLLRVVAGQPEALALLYDRYAGQVFGLAWRIVSDAQVAEEVTQDVFLRVWQSATSYRFGSQGFRGWLLTMTRYRAIDELRSRRGSARRRESAELNEDAFVAPDDPARDTAERDFVAMVQRAIDDLPERQRQTVRLAVFYGKTHSEIASELAAPLGSVKSWLRAGLEKLRKSVIVDWREVGE